MFAPPFNRSLCPHRTITVESTPYTRSLRMMLMSFNLVLPSSALLTHSLQFINFARLFGSQKLRLKSRRRSGPSSKLRYHCECSVAFLPLPSFLGISRQQHSLCWRPPSTRSRSCIGSCPSRCGSPSMFFTFPFSNSHFLQFSLIYFPSFCTSTLKSTP